METPSNSKPTPKTKEQFLCDAEEFHQRLIQNRIVKRIDIASVSTTAKIPFKALELRESLYYRITELSGVAIGLHRQCKITSAIIITRSLFESVALCYYVYKQLKKVVDTGDLGEIDEILMRAACGRPSSHLKPFKPSIIIDELEKEFKGAKSRYAFMCEFTHTNWMGCEGAYTNTNYNEYYVEFSDTYEHISPNTGLNELLMCLTIFEHYYNKMADLLPKLTEICEADIEKGMDKN
jgi:hypothetical protein